MFDHRSVIECWDDQDNAVLLKQGEWNSEAGLDGMRPDGSQVREDRCRGASNAIVNVKATASYGKMQIVVFTGGDDTEYVLTNYGIFYGISFGSETIRTYHVIMCVLHKSTNIN